MPIDVLDPAIRGATASVLLLAAIVFARDARSDAARFGAALSLSAIVYLALARQDSGPGVLVPITIAGNLAIPLFWLFARAWFDDGFVFQRRDLLQITGFAGLWVLHLRLGQPAGGLAAKLTGMTVLFASAAFVVDGLWTAWRGRDDDLVEPRRRMRLAFVAGVGFFILWALMSEAYARSTGLFPQWRTVNAALLFVLVLALASALLALRRGDMFPLPAGEQAAAELRPIPDPRLATALDRLMTHDRIYRSDGLTIGALAAWLDVPDYRLRLLINRALGFRNFNEYLNHHRLAEVTAALADPDQAEVPILTIALDAGFGSLAPFNRAFKAAVGATPREFRRTALGNVATD